jgi:hypothetical protein
MMLILCGLVKRLELSERKMAMIENCCMAEVTAGTGMHDVVCNIVKM